MRNETAKQESPASTEGPSPDHLKSERARLIVAGAGYVGLATATGFARQGHYVDLVETDLDRVECLGRGELPFAEPSLADSFSQEHTAGRIVVHHGYATGLHEAEFAFICTPTPPMEDGQLDTSYVYSAAQSLTEVCREQTRIVIRSTVGPGTTSDLDAWVRARRADMTVLVNPEFLREGSSLHDFEQPSRVVIGGSDVDSVTALASLYTFVNCSVIRVDGVTAELIKLGANSALAVRVSLANELAHLAHSLGADVNAVIDGVGADGRIGRSYLNPGIGFGGACLPKDLSALRTAALINGVPTAVFDGAQRTNEIALQRLINEVTLVREREHDSRVTVIGVAFKPGSDSVRESQAMSLVRALLQEGFAVTVFDPLAEEAARRAVGDCVTFAEDAQSALRDCGVAIIVNKALLDETDLECARAVLVDDLGRRLDPASA